MDGIDMVAQLMANSSARRVPIVCWIWGLLWGRQSKPPAYSMLTTVSCLTNSTNYSALKNSHNRVGYRKFVL